MNRPRIGGAMLMFLAVIALSVGSACGPASVEAQWPRGGTPGIPGVKGVIELLLFNRGTGETMFQAMGRAEGDGLIDNGLYSMWVADQEGHLLLIDSGRADEKCDVNPDTGEEVDCEVELHLRSQVQPAPFQVTTLLGLTATIRQGLGSIGTLEQAPIVVKFAVNETNL